jgi:tetratricopeptide (TPR) repeat protein
MDLSTAAQIDAALADNWEQPHGPARTARAEEIVAAAEVLDDGLLVKALNDLMSAYEYGAESAKSPVAFARLLRLLDQRPESFTDQELHQTHWRFKWVTSALLGIPDVSLTSITGWISEMERRYRQAGYSMRTVAQQRLFLAMHTGDSEGTEQALREMLSLPRDRMSDCVACEDRALGRAHARAGRDTEALAAWADVLGGRRRCAEEPHHTLADSLLPLLRLAGPDPASADQARANHLHGYRLVRANPNLASPIGKHLEYCALTGNPGRGLEIMADSQPLLTSVTDPLVRLDFLGGVALLLGRLTAAGYGAVPVAGTSAAELAQRAADEAAGLAARFDARNGTSAVGDRLRRRLEREPFGTAAPVTESAEHPAEHPAEQPAGEPAEDLAALVARARQLTESLNPDADEAWARVAALAGDDVADPVLAAELADVRADTAIQSRDWAGAARELYTAADLFEGAGLPGRAVAIAARADWSANQADVAPGTWQRLDARLDRVLTLLAGGAALPRDLLTVRHSRAAAAMADLSRDKPGREAEPADPGAPIPDKAALARAEATALAAQASEHGDARREAAAEEMLAALDQLAGNMEGAIPRLRRSIELTERTARPWQAAPMRCQLGHMLLYLVQDPAGAAAELEAALALAAAWPKADIPIGSAHMLLSRAYQEQDNGALAVANARMGVARMTDDAPAHLRARNQLGHTLAQAGQFGEAITTLDAVIPELGDPQLAANSRAALAQCLVQTGDQHGAAEQFALAAAAFEAAGNTEAHLFLSADAALALANAGLWPQAWLAYDKAVALAREHARWQLLVRLERERAQVAVRDGGSDGPSRALAHIEQALAAVPDGEPDAASWRAQTCLEAGRALNQAERYEDAVSWLDRAAADFGDDVGFARAAQLAAIIEGQRLGRPDAAASRLTAAIERCDTLGYQEASASLVKLAARFSD